jgi:hypothetical protein
LYDLKRLQKVTRVYCNKVVAFVGEIPNRFKQKIAALVNLSTNSNTTMTKAANSPDKPSPSDSPTEKPVDNGHKSVVKKEDKEYHADNANFGNVDKKRRNDEEPVNPIKTPPKE